MNSHLAKATFAIGKDVTRLTTPFVGLVVALTVLANSSIMLAKVLVAIALEMVMAMGEVAWILITH